LSLKTWLQSKYPSIIAYLQYDTDKLDFITNETIRAYPAENEDECINLDKLYYFGKVTFLQNALDDLAVNLSFVGGSNQKAAFSRKDIYNQVQQLLLNTLEEGKKYTTEYGIRIGKMVYKNDPYDPLTYEDFYSV
jgi:hypothetical protein